MVSHGLALGERTRVQGLADSLTWGTAAFASLASGIVVESASYTALGFLGMALLVAPAALLVLRGRTASAAIA